MLSQQQIQLNLLHNRHINNMLQLEKERLLLNKQNPYKQTVSYQKEIRPGDLSRLPILQPNSVVEKMLYYPPSQLQGEIAVNQGKLILDSWNSECRNFPKDIHFRKMMKYEIRPNFKDKLTQRGSDFIEEQLIYAKKNCITKPSMTIREKFGQTSKLHHSSENRYLQRTSE